MRHQNIALGQKHNKQNNFSSFVTDVPDFEGPYPPPDPTPTIIGEVNTKYKTVDKKVRPVATEVNENHAQPLRSPPFDPPLEHTPVHWPTPIWDLPRIETRRITAERLALMDFGPDDFLTPQEREALIKVTLYFADVFTFDRSEKGQLKPEYADPYIIKTIPHQPWIGKNIPLPKSKMTEIHEIYKEQLRNGDLEPSDSPYCTPHFFVQKKDGKLRKVVDLSELNRVTIRDANVPPNIVEFTEQLAGRVCYGGADAYSFFDQIMLAIQSRHLTAIRTTHGLLQSTTLPQGGTNSPAYAQRVSTHLFRHLIPHQARVFVDDLVMLGPTSDYNNEFYLNTNLRRWFVEYLITYSMCLRIYQHSGITVSGEKFIAIARKLTMTGVIVDKDGRHPDPSKIAKLESWPCPPPDVSSLRGFLGLANYLRPFIPDFATIDEPLRKLLTGRFRWNEKATKAIRAIQKAASQHPILSNIDYETGGPLILAVDSSNIAAGWALFQEDEKAVNGRRLIQYGSVGFSDVEQRYSQAKLELCGVYKAIRILRYYIYGTRLVLEVDAASLRQMINNPDVPNAAMTRWIEYLKYFDIEVKHVPAKLHTLPDGLSRTDFKNQVPAEEWPDEKIGLGAEAMNGREEGQVNYGSYVMGEDEYQRIGISEGNEHQNINKKKTYTQEKERTTEENMESDSTETESSVEEREGDENQDGDTNLPFNIDKYSGKWLQLGLYLASGAQYRTISDLPAARKRWVKKQLGRYFVREGRLYKRRENELPVMVIDNDEEKHRIMHEAHEVHGHRGRDAMMSLVSKRFWWEKMTVDCIDHKNSCGPCQRRRHATEREEFRTNPVPRMFTDFAMDLVDLGPDVGEKRYMIVARDGLTGWPEARLLSDKTSASVRTFLEEDVIARYGSTIRTILTDNGTENAGETGWIIQHLGYKHAHSTPYNPEGNGMVERGHASLVEGLLKASYDDRARTASYLPSILWADRITTKRTSGYSPYELVYGLDPVLPMDVEFKTFIAFDWDSVKTTADLLAFRSRQLKRRTDDLERARIRIEQARSQGRAYADEREAHQLREPLRPQDLVLVRNPTHQHRAQDRWLGPYRVISQRPGGSYQLAELDKTIYGRLVAAKHIRKYFVRPQLVNREEPLQDSSSTGADQGTSTGREGSEGDESIHDGVENEDISGSTQVQPSGTLDTEATLPEQALEREQNLNKETNRRPLTPVDQLPYRLPRAKMSRPALPHRDIPPAQQTFHFAPSLTGTTGYSRPEQPLHFQQARPIPQNPYLVGPSYYPSYHPTYYPAPQQEGPYHHPMIHTSGATQPGTPHHSMYYPSQGY
ncbi:hypothetical protein CF319_g3572 [Tilletia indica]|nr:hypothetical protein CF319_g3572 [Tilletia indica]